MNVNMTEHRASLRYLVKDGQEAVDFCTHRFGYQQCTSAAPAFADVSSAARRGCCQQARSRAGRPMPDGPNPAPGGWNRLLLVVEGSASERQQLRDAAVRFRNEIVTGPGGQQIPLDDPSGGPIRLLRPAAACHGQGNPHRPAVPSATLR